MNTELKAKLEQAKEDKRLQGIVADKEIAHIEHLIADGEVTYSIGDRFGFSGDKYFLAYMGGRKVGLCNLRTGGSFETRGEAGNTSMITKAEFAKIQCGRNYTRYWDARKQEKC